MTIRKHESLIFVLQSAMSNDTLEEHLGRIIIGYDQINTEKIVNLKDSEEMTKYKDKFLTPLRDTS
ncbi:MAG: hypothetical protein IH840_05720 [Candidatus Heimdallarchaeota archaeon]|nr:hypothetical protein [Candidatus Heimdallarchaeota archaeon]